MNEAQISPKDGEIKDIPDVPQKLFEAAKNGRLVVFVGAGVSRIIGCPSWIDFAIKQLKDLYDKKAINFHEYENLKRYDARKLLSICKKIYKEKNIPPQSPQSLLQCDKDLREKYSIFEDLYSINAIYVTTNYDIYLDEIAKKPRPESISISEKTLLSHVSIEKESRKSKIFYQKEELLISNLTNGTVLHLHGSITEESSMIVTIVDYMKTYEKSSYIVDLLEQIFNDYTVLFVGYGLEEYEILEFMISKSLASEHELRHFMLYPIFKNETNLFEFQKKYHADLGINLMPYTIDENGFEQLTTVIKAWARQIGPLSRPQKFLDRIKLIDEVI
jgi:hypothetical protein